MIITNKEIRVGKMAQLLKLLPHRYEYLSSVPENPGKKAECMAQVCNSSNGKKGGADK